MHTYIRIRIHYDLVLRAFSFAGEQRVSDYVEMEATLIMTPFSFGAIPEIDTDLEFCVGLNVAAFITSPPQPPSALGSSSQNASTETVVVSILEKKDRLRAMEACLDENSLVNVRVAGQYRSW